VGDDHWQPWKISHDQLNAAIWERARRQHGNVTRGQLLELGLGKGGIEWRLRTGALIARYTGVYCLAPVRLDPPAQISAAVLAGGSHAAASHATAAYLWGFLPHYEPPPEISLPTGDRRPRHILTHRCPSLQPRDVTHQHGVPTTTRARTLLDLAPRLPATQLTRLVNDQRRDGRLRLAALDDIIARHPHHPGTTLLRPFVQNPRTSSTPRPASSSNSTAATSTTTRTHSETTASATPKTSSTAWRRCESPQTA
jgi:hypothetical protein